MGKAEDLAPLVVQIVKGAADEGKVIGIGWGCVVVAVVFAFGEAAVAVAASTDMEPSEEGFQEE